MKTVVANGVDPAHINGAGLDEVILIGKDSEGAFYFITSSDKPEEILKLINEAGLELSEIRTREWDGGKLPRVKFYRHGIAIISDEDR